MTKDEAKLAVYELFKEELEQTPDDSGKGYECPICHSGTHGNHGTGITENPHSPDHYTCWAGGCFQNADAFDIIALMEHKEPGTAEAMRTAYQRYGITYERERRNEVTKGEQQETVVVEESPKMNEEQIDQTDYFNECISRMNDKRAQEYLELRAIPTEVAAAHRIGFDPAWKSPAALRRGKNPPESPRLIIPTSRYSYIARDIRPDATNYTKMKEGEVHIFNGNSIYNPHDERPCFVTEGEIDALSIEATGARAIALGSTSNVKTLLEGLEKRTPTTTLIISLDNDEKGQKATRELTAGLKKLNIPHIVSNVSGNHKDQNEALTADKAQFCKAVQDAVYKAAAKPDNVSAYMERLLMGEIEQFKKGATRKTGYANLDKEANGVYPGLYALGAISSLGKTTFILQMADQMAELGEHVMFFSLEQSRLELVSKSLARTTRILNKKPLSSLEIRAGKLDRKTIDNYMGKVGDRMNIIEGNFGCNISFIRNTVERYIFMNDVKPVVIIDYLQIIQPDTNKSMSTKESVDLIITALKRMSRDLDIPVFVISSLNRANYLTPLDFESFKESGSIEYTCDVVLGLQLWCITHDDKFKKDNGIAEKRRIVHDMKSAPHRDIELVCLKNRYGKSNYSVRFDYMPKYDYFDPVDVDAD